MPKVVELNVIETVIELFQEHGVNLEIPGDEDSMVDWNKELESLGIDSLDVLEIVMGAENSLSISVEDSHIDLCTTPLGLLTLITEVALQE